MTDTATAERIAGTYETEAIAAEGWSTSGSEAHIRATAALADQLVNLGVGPEAQKAFIAGQMTFEQAVATKTGAAAPGTIGIPGTVPAGGRVRGRIMTAVARVMPNGQSIPISVRPGRPVVMSTDVSAAKRLKRVQKLCRKLFPRRRTKRSVFKPNGKAIC